jgi:hypothetical protein
MAVLPNYMAGSVLVAKANLEEATLRAGTHRVDGLAFNRNDSDGMTQDELSIIRLDNERGSPLACVVNYACHPVTMPPENTKITRDFPGVACTIVERATGADTIFVQGACGDINPLLTHQGKRVEVGTALAEAILEGIDDTQIMTDTTIMAFSERVQLPLQPASKENLERLLHENRKKLSDPSLEELQRRWARFYTEYAESMLGKLERNSVETAVEVELQVMRWGKAVILGQPSELFYAFADAMERESPFQLTMIAGFANDYIGYVPREEEIRNRTYSSEKTAAWSDRTEFVPNVGDILTDHAVRLIKSVFSPIASPR